MGGEGRFVVFICLFVFLISFVRGIDVKFDCPSSVFVDEEFECSLEVLDGSGVYDVKVEFDSERDSVLKIWDEKNGKWLSGYYYLTEFVEDEANVKLKVSKVGKYDGVLKLRQGEKREVFDIDRVVVKASKILDDDLIEDSGEVLDGKDEVIILGDVVEDVVLGEKVIYESKDSRVVDKLVYGFAVFLIFVIGVLVWERR